MEANKISYSVLNQTYTKIYDEPFDWNKLNTFDDLDYIEFIMTIEHDLDIIINDDVSDFFQKDNNLKKIFDTHTYREEVLKDLLYFTES